MKKLLLVTLVFNSLSAFSQSDTTYWNKGGSLGLNFNQATLNNWAAGGVGSISGGSYFNYIFDYKKGIVVWENSIELGFGLIRESGEPQRKADDRIVFTSKYNREMGNSGKLYYGALLDFRTQFAKGFAEGDDDNYISRFMAPGYLLVSLGVSYKPNEYFSVSFGPAATKFTFVNDQGLADRGEFGVDPATLDNAGIPIVGTGKNFRAEFGATVTATFNKEIFTNGQFTSNIILFTNYFENPDKIDVNWENTLTLRINSVLSANLYNQLIYDFDIKFQDLDATGNPIGQEEDRLQFKNIMGLGLAYSFGGSRG